MYPKENSHFIWILSKGRSWIDLQILCIVSVFNKIALITMGIIKSPRESVAALGMDPKEHYLLVSSKFC